MTATAVTPAKSRPVDPLLIVMAVGFVVAVGALAYPAFRADPTSAPGLVLIFTVGAVALIGLFAFARTETRRPLGDATVDLLDAMAEPAALVWSTGQVLAFNGAWAEANGATVALPKGKSASALYMAFAQARAGEQGRAIVVIGEREQEVLIGQAGEGRFLVRAAPEAVLPVGAPVMPRHAAASNAVESRAMAAGAPFGSAVVAADDLFSGKVEEPNAALSVLTGPAAARDAAFGHLFDPAGVAEARLKLDGGSSGPIELVARAFPDRMLHLYVAPEGDRRRIWLFDVTAQKSMELQLSQAQKMQAVGQLAGGVAHDFNNLLTAIQLQLSGLLERHPVGDPSYEGLNEIRQTAIRAADLVRKLLAFSRKSTVRRERLDLGELVGEFAVLLRRLLREDVRLETDYGRDLPVVLADKSQLETAVMNLAVNARDAMRGVVEPGAGVVTIRTARLTAEEARLLGWNAAATAAVALIEVSDSGPGVPPELLDKIFEPFFTTKAVNEGTGMGLATVYGIVEQAGGHINVSNAPAGGAVFRIFLPEAAEADLAETPVIEKVAKAPRDLSGAGRILFVEDEAAVRGIAARLLRQRGYEVIEAEDGEQALELAELHAGTIDMMISDVIMPGLDGPALLKKARQYLGDAPVLFISGYAESDFSDLLQDEVGVSFLPKPLDIKTLAERVKQELHAG
ncbi:MAG: response regulator [Alphaproteobacteria bacterium]|jgi:two-component system, cell cycle sensor histidine kinase and response regulator CckA|nr:response regulator [Alphaproteobacteria bacterium]MBU2042835.1 response regulator [Alphaproteobacteria bacterium]MBU2125331.1 response regulator [Alphaproteobacteria bacterium]MBU2208050.1 response regulator [Alphaproteobacteria bacterium]MBU2289516.1 response regulator [Alphaproteobacteria bacterium]